MRVHRHEAGIEQAARPADQRAVHPPALAQGKAAKALRKVAERAAEQRVLARIAAVQDGRELLASTFGFSGEGRLVAIAMEALEDLPPFDPSDIGCPGPSVSEAAPSFPPPFSLQ